MPVLDAAERLKQDVGSLLESGREVAREYGSVGAAFRRLVLSDISLARTALVRGLVFLLLCTLAVGTAWVVAMAILVVGLQQIGLSLLMALLLPFLISCAVAFFAWRGARKALAYADLDATRRQLAAWFPPTQPISTAAPDGAVNPGPPDPDGPIDPITPTAP
jgi:hypothetical protein